MEPQGKEEHVVIVAASKHRSSLSALEWALRSKVAVSVCSLKLVHIRPVLRAIPSPMGGSVPESTVNPEIVAAYRDDCASKIIQDLQAHENLCCRYKVQAEFHIMEGDDTVTSLLDAVFRLRANKLVIGKSRTTLLRKLKGGCCIPDAVLKCALNSCTVFVISKGKLISVKSPQNPLLASSTVDKQASDGISSCSSSNTFSSSYSGGSHLFGHGDCSRQKTLPWEQGDCPYMPSQSVVQENNVHTEIPFSFNGPKQLQLEKHLQVAIHVATAAKQDDSYVPTSILLQAARLNVFAKEEATKRQAAVAEAQEAKRELTKQVKLLEAAKLALEAEFRRRTKIEAQAIQLASMAEESLARRQYREYSFEELQHATDYFAPHNQIGEGAYGYVYKGRLHHTPVAIKVLKQNSTQGAVQFQREIEFFGRMRHPNIVLLLGACPGHGCLVYEYLANGSLEDRLLCRGNTAPLSWQTRCRIIKEVATALLFLHSFEPNGYVHRDLKPANILLTQNWVSKLGDVGLSALASNNIPYEITLYKETTPVGTIAYIDPDYKRTGIFTPRSDVYAFGVVMLQLLTGKSPFVVQPIVRAALKEKKLDMVLDASAGEWPSHVAASLSQIAIRLTKLKPRNRPDLKEILPDLEKVASDLG